VSYRGGRLSPLFEADPGRLCRRMAERGGSEMVRNVKANTPIGAVNSFDPHTPGALRASIEQITLRVYPHLGSTVYESGAETNLHYAPYVEHGTGLFHRPDPHTSWTIRPRHPDGWLSWIDPQTGERIFAKKVVHHGAPGSHMFEFGAHITEHEFNAWGEQEVRDWMYEAERHWTAQRPVYYGRRV
jgi:hypothetical protein